MTSFGGMTLASIAAALAVVTTGAILPASAEPLMWWELGVTPSYGYGDDYPPAKDASRGLHALGASPCVQTWRREGDNDSALSPSHRSIVGGTCPVASGVGGRFITTKPDCRRCSTRRSAAMFAMKTSASCVRLRELALKRSPKESAATTSFGSAIESLSGSSDMFSFCSHAGPESTPGARAPSRNGRSTFATVGPGPGEHYSCALSC
jgi:hypothetical protein